MSLLVLRPRDIESSQYGDYSDPHRLVRKVPPRTGSPTEAKRGVRVPDVGICLVRAAGVKPQEAFRVESLRICVDCRVMQDSLMCCV